MHIRDFLEANFWFSAHLTWIEIKWETFQILLAQMAQIMTQMGHFGGRDAKKQNNPAFYRQFFHYASHDGSVSEPAAVPGDLGKT